MTKVAGTFQVPSAMPDDAYADAPLKKRRTAHGVCLLLLLQERRTALISAAVTGKVDVRNFERTTIKT